MALRSAATAETWGHAIDVPESIWNLTTRVSSGTFRGDDASLQAANIFSPGAVISGCKKTNIISGLQYARPLKIELLT